MSPKKLVNRIPHEDIKTLESWSLPSVSGRKPSSSKTAKKSTGKESIEEIRPEDLKPITAEQLQKVTQDAENEGREKGYQEGLQQGFSEGEKNGEKNGETRAYKQTKALLDQKKQSFQQITAALLDPVAMQDKALENLVLDMAVNLAKHLIGREISSDASCLFELVEKAVDGLPTGAKNIRIYLQPDDAVIAQEAFENAGKNWHFHADATLSRGGCRIESDESLIDYSVEKRIAQMLETVHYQGDVALGSMSAVKDHQPALTEPTVEPPAELEIESIIEPEPEPQAETESIAPPAATPDPKDGQSGALDSE